MPPRHVGRMQPKQTIAGELTVRKRGALVRNGAIFAILLAVLAAMNLRKFFSGGPADVTPLKAPLLKDLPQFQGQYADNMLWGTYRSGLYFGMRTRLPRSLLAGLMWFDPDRPETVYKGEVRHAASQGDGLTSYGWLRHDGVRYGVQQLLDREYNITLSLVKHKSEHSGRGGDWAVRVQTSRLEGPQQPGEPRPPRRRLSLVFYMAEENAQQEVEVHEPHSRDGGLLLSGDNPDLGPWELHWAPVALRSKKRVVLHHLGAKLQTDGQLTELPMMVNMAIQETSRRRGSESDMALYLPDVVQQGANMVMVQLVVGLPATLDLVFLSASGRDSSDRSKQLRMAQLSGEGLTQLLAARQAGFEAALAERFAPQALPPDVAQVAQAALSNTVGSMGYFYGSSRVQLGEEVVDYWPSALYTAVPSRSFFPRGFLWDEGFHQLLLLRWAPQLSRDAIAHWLDLMNKHGWIPREQILGAEARSRVPPEFISQHPTHANPPSLFLPILAMAQQLEAADAAGGDAAASSEAAATREFLKAAWPRLEKWYHWFNTTQAGPVPGSYRWHGREPDTDRELNPKTLTSGLDDYPRASHPTDEERHLDLRCWMAMASQAMASIGSHVGIKESKVRKYKAAAAHLSHLPLLNALHLDPGSGHYLDWGLHSEEVELVRQEVMVDGQLQSVLRRVVHRAPEPRFVPSYGYVSLFPLMMHLLPHDSPELGTTLAALRDPKLLWTPSGLRSLATTSSLYKKYNTEHDAPYWRGQIWINLNFLTLRALKHYSQVEGPHRVLATELHEQLRENLVGNIVEQYHASGYLWEQYDDGRGVGMGSHPFTGWTALVALIATGAY